MSSTPSEPAPSPPPPRDTSNPEPLPHTDEDPEKGNVPAPDKPEHPKQ